METKLNLKSIIQDQIGTIIGFLFLSLSSCLAVFGETLLPIDKLSMIKAPIWAKTVSILLLAILSLVIYLWADKKLRLKYNIYWDRKRNPHCPICKKPLQSHSYCSYQCIACDKYIFPSNEFGKSLPIEIVHRLLRGEKVTDNEIENIHNAHKPEPMTYCTTVKMKEPHP
jgi:hypothetical protein